MSYSFTVDWTTRAVPLWKRCFKLIGKPDIAILEIGTYEGRSSCWFSDNMMDHENALLHCVDPYTQDEDDHATKLLNEARHQQFIENIAQSKNSVKIEYYKMSSDDFFDECERTYDFIYIDGGHLKDQVVRDLLNAEIRLNKPGVMIIDDVWFLGKINQLEHGVGEALHEVLPFKTLTCVYDGVKLNHKQSAYIKF